MSLVYPLPRVADRKPLITQAFLRPSHLGVDIMYAWRPGDPITGARVARSRRGDCLYYVPLGVRVLSVGDGHVVYARQASNGWRTRIELKDGTHVLDLHMTELVVRAGERVHAGQPLGTCGGDPTDLPLKLVHDHHEHRRKAGKGEVGVDGWGMVPYDPASELASAEVVADHGA